MDITTRQVLVICCFWWRSGFFRGSWIIFQDSLPLEDRALTDILQRISAFYERISTKLFGDVRRGPRTNRLDFGGNTVLDPDTGFPNPDQDLDPDGFRWYAWQADSTRQMLVINFI